MAYTQSQGHGFAIEDDLRQKVWNLEKCHNNTDAFDIHKDRNRWNPNEHVSIKTMKGYTCCFGDVRRFYDRCDASERITLLIVRYTQDSGEKRIREIVEMDYSEELKRLLFGTITRQELEEYVALICAIPSGHVSNIVRKEYLIKKKELQETHQMRIQLSPKVDSKGQRRVQCAIPHLDTFWEEFPQCILAKTTDQVRGIPITTTYASPPRIRKAKCIEKRKQSV
jgi:hypothetical protein